MPVGAGTGPGPNPAAPALGGLFAPAITDANYYGGATPTLVSTRPVIVENIINFGRGRASNLLIITPSAYNNATDVQRLPQAKVFGEPEAFAQAQKPVPLILNGKAGYSFTQDPVLRVPMSKVFSDPETFVKPQAAVLTVWNVYVPAYDVQRQQQAKVFSDPETFAQSQRGAPLLTNGTAGYSFTQDPTLRSKQSKVFSDPEVFIKPQIGFLIATLPSVAYNPATDVQRWPQQKYFSDAEVFSSRWNPAPLLTNGTGGYSSWQDVQFLRPQQKVFVDPEVFVQPRVGRPLVTNVIATADIFSGNDTYGWPPEEIAWSPRTPITLLVITPSYNPAQDVQFLRPQQKVFTDPETFAKQQAPNVVVWNVYVPAYDVLHGAQAKVFGDTETFSSNWKPVPLLLNGSAGYSSWQDVQFLRAQQKIFSDPEVFAKAQNLFSPVVLPFVVYNPATDVQRALQAKFFAEQETFGSPWFSFSVVVINGTAITPSGCQPLYTVSGPFVSRPTASRSMNIY